MGRLRPREGKEQSSKDVTTPKVELRLRGRRRPVGSAVAAGFLYLAHFCDNASSLLHLDQVPNRMTNERSATFTYVCTPLDVADGVDCNVKWSLDSASWEAAGRARSITLHGLRDGVHSLSLKHDYTADGRSETEIVDYTWTVDTVPPDTIVDTGPSQEGEAPRPEEADPFLFFTFHCSEDLCKYRYQFDNRTELTATWTEADGDGLEGQVSVIQVGGSLDAGGVPAKLQISVFLTAASSFGDPENSQVMPSTVSIFNTGGVFPPSSGEAGPGSRSNSGGGGINATGSATGGGGGSSSSSRNAVAKGEDVNGALVVLALGPPEVDSGTGNTVFSLSAEVEVPDLIELNSTLAVEVSSNTSALLASASLEESMTSKEWLRWPYASELPGKHMVAIAAVDEAGNVDPSPAVWTWSVDARPRTSLTSAPQEATPVDTAFFSFACALPGTEAAPLPPEHSTVTHGVQSGGGGSSDGSSNKNNSDIILVGASSSGGGEGGQVQEEGPQNNGQAEEGEDGGWEIQEGGHCTYFFSLDGGNFSAVEPASSAALAAATVDGGDSSSSSISSPVSASAGSTLLLTGLADGTHELSVYACEANRTECDPQPLTHTWKTDTSPPVTTILSFPDQLTPSVFTFGSSKPMSRFMCRMDGGMWRQCDKESEFPLSDGMHTLAVMAVDPTGRSDPKPVHYSWEVSMLDTSVEFCPPTHVPFDTPETRVLLSALYDGVVCASAMWCQIRYTLEWETSVPASTGGECVAPPTTAPTPAPVPLSLPPVEEGGGDDGHASRNGEGSGGGGVGPPEAEGGVGYQAGGGDGGVAGGTGGSSPSPGQNFLSRSVVQCAEVWANCTTIKASTSYQEARASGSGGGGGGCTKREKLIGEVGHSHGTLVMRKLPVGEYNLTLEAFNGFGVVDRGPVVCPFKVLAEDEAVDRTQIVMVRTPAKVLDSPHQVPVLFEFQVADIDMVGADKAANGANSATAGVAAAAGGGAKEMAPPRLSYLVTGPGAVSSWQAVPAIPVAEWEALLELAKKNNGTSTTSSASSEDGGGGDGGGGGFVWGLELEGLADGEYRLQVRDEVLGDTAEYTWRADMSVPELTVDALPQDPSHSAGALFVLRCSKLLCALEYQLNDDGVWHLWDAAEEDVEHAHASRAPTPAPSMGELTDSSGSPELYSDGSDGGGGSSGGGNGGVGREGLGIGDGEGDGDAGGSSSSSGGSAGDSEGVDSNVEGDASTGGGDGSTPAEEIDATTVTIFAEQVSSHEISFRVNVTVPESGNYSLAARPARSSLNADSFGSALGVGRVSSRSPPNGTDGDGSHRLRRRLEESAASSPPLAGGGGGGGDGGDHTVRIEWEVDLTRPDTVVVSRPGAVTTAGVAVFQFACTLAGEIPRDGCFYQYQMMAVNADTDWDSLGWLPTADSVKLYEIGEGVNKIRVRALDSKTELYDLAPSEVVWVRDATPPKLEWLWVPEKVSHLSEALFEFTCSGELSLTATGAFGRDDDSAKNADLQVGTSPSQPSSSTSSSASPPSSTSAPLSSSPSSFSASSASFASGGEDDDSASLGAAAFAAAYPTAFPRVLPSGCAFEASLDGADFEAVPNSVSLTGLSNGDHRFSVRASDLAGNVAETTHFEWTVDTSVPDTVLVAGPAAVTSSTLGNFRILDTVGAKDSKGQFEYRLDPSSDDAPWVSTQNTTLYFGGLPDGPHTLAVRARETEAKGGDSDRIPEVMSWTVDTESPDTNFVVLPDVVTHLTSTVLVVKGTDTATSTGGETDGADHTACTFEYAVDQLGEDDGGIAEAGGSSSSALSSPSRSSSSRRGGNEGVDASAVVWQKGDSSGVIHLHQLKEGRHEIRVRAVDSAGNADPSPATYSWIVDRAGVYGHPSMVTDVVAEGGNEQAFVKWAAAADDGGGTLTKYVVIASTSYKDIKVEAITAVTHGAEVNEYEDGAGAAAGGALATETTMTGLTNGLVYSFQVVAANAFGYSTRSLPSNKVATYDPADPCGLVTCGDHGSCFIQRSQSNALKGYCVCHPGYSGSDCSVVASGTDDSSVVLGAYPGSWGECDMKCGGGMRYRTVQCLQYLDGIPMAPLGNDTTCWQQLGETETSYQAMRETSCRNIACLALFLDVKMRLRAFYDDACFTVAAQDAFLSGFAAEVAHALNIKVELVIDLNAFQTDKHNEMEVRFIIAPGQSGADQPIENLREQLLLQAASPTSSFRSRGTWTRKLIPESVEVSQGTYELPPLSVRGIASDLVMILMVVGTTCLGVAVYGACSSRRSKKWESVYDGEYGRYGPQSPGSSPDGEGGPVGDDMDSNSHHVQRNSTGGRASGGIGGGSSGNAVRQRRWFELDDDSEDFDSDDDWDEEDDEDERSPFFGRCALRSLLCRDDDADKDESSCKRKGADVGSDDNGAREGGGSANRKGSCGCTCECGSSRRPGPQNAGGSAASAPIADGGADVGCANGCCTCGNNGTDNIELTRGPIIDPSNVDVEKLPLPLTGRNRPPPPLSGEAVLHRRRGWGFGGGSAPVGGVGGRGGGSRGGGGALAAASRDEEDGDGGGRVVRARGLGSASSGSGVVQVSDVQMSIQRPGQQALV